MCAADSSFLRTRWITARNRWGLDSNGEQVYTGSFASNFEPTAHTARSAWPVVARLDLSSGGHVNPRDFREGGEMLEHSDVAARLPAQDLKRAKAFYADKLGLMPIEER